jgi:hypothetical protein
MGLGFKDGPKEMVVKLCCLRLQSLPRYVGESYFFPANGIVGSGTAKRDGIIYGSIDIEASAKVINSFCA